MASVFTQIVNGDIPAWKVAETNKFLAFLDVNPVTLGHTLVIPKQEVDNLFDLDEETYSGLFLFAKVVQDALVKVVPCTRVGVAVVGLEVPHAHIHLIPLQSMSDFSFAREKVNCSEAEFSALASQVAEKIS
ncbi:MAG: HIT family protein [Bacteroidetes bacterium]|nr:HIT family protein [Bacteroidota bacterium]